MATFKSLFKIAIKALTGFELLVFGRGSFALVRENIETRYLHPASLILMEKAVDEIERASVFSDYLRRLRLKAILEKYQINIVLDVGANEGQFAADLRHIDYKGRIVSFEPIASAFAVLKQASLSDPNWDVHQIALGSHNGEQKINVADVSVFTSFLKSNSWCEQEFGKNSLGSKEEIVIVRRLDEVLQETVDKLDCA